MKYFDVSTHQYWKLSFPMKRSNNDNNTKESIFCVWIEFNTLSIFQYVEQCSWHFRWKGGIEWFESHEKVSKKDKLLRFCQNQSDGLLINFRSQCIFNKFGDINLTNIFAWFHWESTKYVGQKRVFRQFFQTFYFALNWIIFFASA